MAATPPKDFSQTVLAILERQYDEVAARRTTLSGQGSSLVTFAGIIQTILIAPMIALATSPTAQTALKGNTNINLVEPLFGLGFAAYLLTLVLGVLAFRETKWGPAPVLLFGKDAEAWRAELDLYNDDTKPQRVPLAAMEVSIETMINSYNKVNDEKFRFLRIGYISLLVGVFLSAVGGYLLLLGSV